MSQEHECHWEDLPFLSWFLMLITLFILFHKFSKNNKRLILILAWKWTGVHTVSPKSWTQRCRYFTGEFWRFIFAVNSLETTQTHSHFELLFNRDLQLFLLFLSVFMFKFLEYHVMFLQIFKAVDCLTMHQFSRSCFCHVSSSLEYFNYLICPHSYAVWKQHNSRQMTEFYAWLTFRALEVNELCACSVTYRAIFLHSYFVRLGFWCQYYSILCAPRPASVRCLVVDGNSV